MASLDCRTKMSDNGAFAGRAKTNNKDLLAYARKRANQEGRNAWEGKGDRRPGRQEAGEGKSSNALFRRTEDHHSQPEGRIEDWRLPRDAETARHKREGLEVTAMNSARDERNVWKL